MIKSSDTSSSFRLDINKHYCCTSEHQLSCRTRTHKREKMSALSLLFVFLSLCLRNNTIMSDDDDAKKKVKTAKKKKEKETKRTFANKIFDRFAALPREYKCAFFLVLLAVVVFPLTTLKERFDEKEKKCPFGFQSRSNVNLESDLPSWHPKLVSYDVEGVNNLEVGPPMLKKNEIAKFDDIIVYRGHFYVKGKLEQKKTQSTQLVEDENELPWDREERKANEMLEKEKSKKEKKKKDVGERIADRFFPLGGTSNSYAKAVAMNNRTKRIMSVASTEEKAKKMIETFRSVGVTVTEVVVTENGDESKLIVPGFHDSHTHVLSLALKREFEVDLSDVETKKEFVTRLKMKESSWAPFPQFSEEWIVASGYDDGKILREDGRLDLPYKGWIDDISNPVIAFRADMHTAIVNQAGFRKANVRWADVKKNTTHEYYRRFRDYIDFDTGEVKDDAMQLFQKVLPKRTKKERKNALERALAPLSKLGITRVSDFGAIDALQAYDFELSRSDYMILRELDNEMRPHGLPLRVNCYLPFDDWQFAALEQERGNGAFFHYTGYKGNELRQKELNLDQTIRSNVRIAGVKLFLDGSLGANTAKFHEPYNSGFTKTSHTATGMFVRDVQHAKQIAILADKAELQIAVHAIGDAAVDAALDMLETIEKTNGKRDRRFRIEHIQHLSGDGSIENLNLKTETVEARIKRLKPIASVQPLHLALDSERALVEKLGRSRMERTHMYKSLSELTTIAFGSDVPIAPANPLEAILQASTKRTLNKEGQSMSVEMALEAQTIGGARASFNEDAFGGFFNGALMDFVVLKKKSSATSNSKEKEESKEEERGEEEIIDDRSIVYETWVSGRKVYSTA